MAGFAVSFNGQFSDVHRGFDAGQSVLVRFSMLSMTPGQYHVRIVLFVENADWEQREYDLEIAATDTPPKSIAVVVEPDRPCSCVDVLLGPVGSGASFYFQSCQLTRLT